MKKYYVYVYLNPLSRTEDDGVKIYNIMGYPEITLPSEPFYVGKGSGMRYLYHLKNNKRNNELMDHFHNKLREIKKYGKEPDVLIVQYFDSESEAYEFETLLISAIGSNHIKEISDGPLTNTCLIAVPPSLKGKTYKEIYGDRAEEERRKRHEKQLAVGGFFRGRKHSAESKKKTSEKIRGVNHPNYGKKLPKEFGDAISKSKKGKHLGKDNKLSKKYYLVNTFTDEKFEVIGQYEVNLLAKQYNLSVGTLHKSLYSNKPATKGKTKGWQLIYQP